MYHYEKYLSRVVCVGLLFLGLITIFYICNKK